MCSEAFIDLDSLIADKEEHTDRKLHLCNLCGKAFTDLDRLIAHEEDHRKVHFFVCAECKKIFTLEEDLDRHLDAHCASNTLNCGLSPSFMTDDFVNDREEYREEQCSNGEERKTEASSELNESGLNIAEYENEQNITQYGRQCSNADQRVMEASSNMTQYDGSFSQCSNADQREMEARSESTVNVSGSNVVESENEQNTTQYGRLFSQYLQVMYHKILRKYRRYRPQRSYMNSLKLKRCKLKPEEYSISQKRTSNSKDILHCNECSKTFKDRHALTVHLRTHSGENLISAINTKKLLHKKVI